MNATLKLMGRFTGSSVMNYAKPAGVLSLATLAGAGILAAFRRDELPAPSVGREPSEIVKLVSTVAVSEDPVLSPVSASGDLEITFSRQQPILPNQPHVTILPETSIVLVGGGIVPKEAAEIITRRCEALSQLPNGGDGSLVICSYATASPLEGFERAKALFASVGKEDVVFMPLPEDEEFSIDEWNGIVTQASGIFFTGGDQKRLYGRLQSKGLVVELQSRLEAGPSVLGGTSAGTAIMAPTMIAGGPEANIDEWPDLYFYRTEFATLSYGISIVPFVTDQHFAQRKRGKRLEHVASFLQQNGLGIDEDTAVHYVGGRYLEVFGAGGVTFVGKSENQETNVQAVSVIPSGATFDLLTHTVIAGHR